MQAIGWHQAAKTKIAVAAIENLSVEVTAESKTYQSSDPTFIFTNVRLFLILDHISVLKTIEILFTRFYIGRPLMLSISILLEGFEDFISL